MIIVFGSLNMDIGIAVEDLPVAGETVIAKDYEISPGGKGGNQALAAQRMGGMNTKIAMVGRVGDDGMGTRILTGLRQEGVLMTGVAESEFPTGMAVVTFDSKGENQIIVTPGANSDITEDQVPDEILKKGNFVLMQMEIPVEENWMLIDRTHANGATTMLNAAPAQYIPEMTLEKLDYLIMNEIEAEQIAMANKLGVLDDPAKIAQAITAKYDVTCIITLGGMGSIAVTPDAKKITVPAVNLEKLVDRTGAGDAYCGTLAAALHYGFSLADAMKRASVAASLSCKKTGAQRSYVYLADIEQNLAQLGEVTITDI